MCWRETGFHHTVIKCRSLMLPNNFFQTYPRWRRQKNELEFWRWRDKGWLINTESEEEDMRTLDAVHAKSRVSTCWTFFFAGHRKLVGENSEANWDLEKAKSSNEAIVPGSGIIDSVFLAFATKLPSKPTKSGWGGGTEVENIRRAKSKLQQHNSQLRPTMASLFSLSSVLH
jgi:hypothetical protein